MTADVSETRPDTAEVTAFVAEVRERLSDLAPDERDDLVDGLEADLAEQLADGATGLLDDPASYAAELRAAAGLPQPISRGRLAQGDRLGGELDRLRGWWFETVDRHVLMRQAWSFAAALRPAWWALRAWVAVTLVDQALGPYEPVTIVPSLLVPGFGMLVLAAAVLGSVLLGRSDTPPGRFARSHGLLRGGLVALNIVAVVGLISLAQHDADSRWRADGYYGYAYAEPTRGLLTVDGRQVRNLYPYDAQGQPITTGVQLFDGAGRPVPLSPQQAKDGYVDDPEVATTVGCPWVNGTQRLWNVFPLPEREQRAGTTCQARLDDRFGPGLLPTPPLAEVPPVALPGAGAVPQDSAP